MGSRRAAPPHSLLSSGLISLPGDWPQLASGRPRLASFDGSLESSCQHPLPSFVLVFHLLCTRSRHMAARGHGGGRRLRQYCLSKRWGRSHPRDPSLRPVALPSTPTRGGPVASASLSSYAGKARPSAVWEGSRCPIECFQRHRPSEPNANCHPLKIADHIAQCCTLLPLSTALSDDCLLFFGGT